MIHNMQYLKIKTCNINTIYDQNKYEQKNIYFTTVVWLY